MKAVHEQKAQVVAGIRDMFEQAKGVVLVDYRGLTVEEDTELRRQFRSAGVTYKVLKNTLIKRAVDELHFEALDSHLEGPTAVAFGGKDPVAPAKVVTAYIKKTNKMAVKAGIIDGKVIDVNGVTALSELPPREVLIAKMLGSINAPVSGLVTVLGGTLRSLLYTLNAVKAQKESA